MEQVSQRSCGCPLHGSVQRQAGWSFEQLRLMEGLLSLPMAELLELDDLQGPFQSKPFYVSMMQYILRDRVFCWKGTIFLFLFFPLLYIFSPELACRLSCLSSYCSVLSIDYMNGLSTWGTRIVPLISVSNTLGNPGSKLNSQMKELHVK